MGLISRVSRRTYRFLESKSNKLKMADAKQKTLRAKELRGLEKKELQEKLSTFRQELATLRVAKVTSGGPSKLGKIHSVRKSIAKVMTVMNQTQKAELQKLYRGKKVKPVDLKPRKTRALRKQLNKHEEGLKKLKQIRRERKFSQKKYALKA